MEIYGMHDAPGGVQNMKSFEYLEKYGRINMPKKFLDPELEIKLRNEREFYNKKTETFKNNCNISNLIQFIKELPKLKFSRVLTIKSWSMLSNAFSK